MSGEVAGHIDRGAWIQHRKARGQDFAPLVERLSKLVVSRAAIGGLLVDSSALSDHPSAVTRWRLVEDFRSGPGFWMHPESGETGPLFELLVVIAELTDPREFIRDAKAAPPEADR